MAEAITYAELRFVKAPLRKSVSLPGQESDEDGELTYENVQVPPGLGGPQTLAPSATGDQADGQAEPPTASRSGAASPAAGRTLAGQGRAACSQYLQLGLLLTCLLLGVAAISLGVRYVQVSQQLRQMDGVLEATNSSLLQQLHLRTIQLGQSEMDLQGSKRELAQSQEALQAEQRVHQAAEERLQGCQSDKEKTQETLQSEVAQRSALQQRLSHVQATLKPFFTCPSRDTCCPVGWTLIRGKCFHISFTERDWEESQRYCKSLSSDLAIDRDRPWSYYSAFSNLRLQLSWDTLYWIGLSFNDGWRWSDGTVFNGFVTETSKCAALKTWSWETLEPRDCKTRLPCICEVASFRFPDEEHPLP
ncbi:B-cell differentiation antigen CD72 [Oryctolagus cuniculus]|uniref:B-cell differentiation antigen CD72 n=1 Tax=Oryctolagus cuniculus TaxID=9986 RepID=UPI00048FF396|nr:B-cell differentiation antigen CD72 [Oryctolagus cuniculus]